MAKNVFNRTPILHPRMSYFKLNEDVKFDCDMGQIIPIYSRYMVPGDYFKIGNEIVARTQPMIAPILHEINVYTYWFFCPLRVLFGSSALDDESKVKEWKINEHDFETFMTGGVDGDDESISLPRWIPTGAMVENDNYDSSHSAPGFKYATGTFASGTDYYKYVNGIWTKGVSGTDYTVGASITANTWFIADNTVPYANEKTPDNGTYSLWDYLGFPTNVKPNGAYPLDFKKRMYNYIWNEYFRDETLDDMIKIEDSNKVMNARWKKDYFTSALPFQQRGTAPALPVNISANVLGDAFVQYLSYGSPTGLSNGIGMQVAAPNYSASDSSQTGVQNNGHNLVHMGGSSAAKALYVNGSQFSVNGSATTFNVSDLRLAFQVQKWMERNLVSGYRWKEFLLGHFGVAPTDERLQRPEYIGGSKSPLIVSEVLQTSQTTQGADASPQGNLAGHGLVADSGYIGKYHAKEFGLLMGVMVIRPKATYQQGIDTEDLYETKYDFMFPEFTHLSEQVVKKAEIFATDNDNLDSSGNHKIFGYQGRYNELRASHSRVAGGLRDKFDFWHVGRKFDSVPSLNSDFLKCVPSKRIFASYEEPGFIITVGNRIDAYRPLPVDPTPGLIDHA